MEPTSGRSAAPGGCCCGSATDLGPTMPKVTFSTFVLSLCSSAMVHLGEVPDPETGRIGQNLELAKHTIDVLCMLKCKTAKCLEPEEAKLLEDLLYELRMVYVKKAG